MENVVVRNLCIVGCVYIKISLEKLARHLQTALCVFNDGKIQRSYQRFAKRSNRPLRNPNLFLPFKIMELLHSNARHETIILQIIQNHPWLSRRIHRRQPTTPTPKPYHVNESRNEQTLEEVAPSDDVSKKVMTACLPHADSFLLIGYLKDTGEKCVLSMRPSQYESPLFSSFSKPVRQWLNLWAIELKQETSQAGSVR
jgi:hypothetical protein